MVSDKNDFAYGFFLGAGVVIFLYGVYKKINGK
jgi:hypothetical protein